MSAQGIHEVGEIDRATYLGGSNAAAIMGLGAYGNTPLTCYMAKVGQGPEEIDAKQQLFLARRKRWEGPIVEMLREEFDGNIVSVNKRYRDPEYDFLAAEIDFEWRDGDGTIQNGEIKTVSPFAFGEQHGWGEAGTSDIPVHYAAQVMHGLGVTKRQTCVVAAMIGLDSMVFYVAERDDDTIAAMRERMVAFWQNHVLPRIPPDPLTLADSMMLATRLRGRPVEIDDKIAAQLDQLRQIRANAKTREGDEAGIKFNILEFVRKAWMIQPGTEPKENAVLLRGGIKVATFNLQSARRIDVEKLREEKPDIAFAYGKESSTRVLRLAKST